MKDNLFDTPEKVNLAKSNFKTLKDHAGWQLLVQIVEANIKVLEEQILNGFENETKDIIDRKRDKLKAYKDVISTPDTMMKRLDDNKPIGIELDPYKRVVQETE